MDKFLKSRIISSLVLVVLCAFVLFERGWISNIIFLFCFFIALYELRVAIGLYRIETYVLSSILFIFTTFVFDFSMFSPVYQASIFAYVFILLVYDMFVVKEGIPYVGLNLFSYFYVSVPIFIFNALLKGSEVKLYPYTKNMEFILWIFLISISTDVFAFIIGTLFGKKKLIESISPKKTVEGAIGAVIVTVLVCCIYRIFFIKSVTLINVIVASLFASIFAQIGDLAGSYIKRQAGIKDFSNIIPGHGGIMDRFDSIFVVSVFIYIVYVLNIL